MNVQGSSDSSKNLENPVNLNTNAMSAVNSNNTVSNGQNSLNNTGNSDTTEGSGSSDNAGGSGTSGDKDNPENSNDEEDPGKDNPENPDEEDPGKDNPENPDEEEPGKDDPENPDEEEPEEEELEEEELDEEDDEEEEEELGADEEIMLAEATIGGNCGAEGDGSNLQWAYDEETETLTISGMGAMCDYGDGVGGPWKAYNPKYLVVEPGATTIGRSAFRSCTSLTEISLPDTLTTIGMYAFYSSAGLTEVSMPASLTTINQAAFQGSGVTKLTFAEGNSGTLTLSMQAFSDCNNLEEVTFPEGITGLSMGNYAFANTNVKDLYLPGSLGTITSATGLTTFDKLETLTIGEGVTQITGNMPFPRTNLREVCLPDTLTGLPANLFYNATKLEKVTTPTAPEGIAVCLPASCTNIGDAAFQDCPSLTGKVLLPAALTTVGAYAFYGCSGITKVTFADGATSLTLGAHAFLNCTALEEVVFPEGLTSISMSASCFEKCSNIKELYIPGSLGTITPDMGFRGFQSVEKITIGEGATELVGSDNNWSKLFSDTLREICLPDSLETIGYYSFWNYSQLEKVTTPTAPEGDVVCLPASCKSIEVAAFLNCGKLTGNLYIPDGVTHIGGYAFQNCASLGEELYLSNNLTTLGSFVFRGNSDAQAPKFMVVHTSLTPFGEPSSYYNQYLFQPGTIRELWFRGVDDTDTAVASFSPGVTEHNVNWGSFLSQNFFTSDCVLYIDDTVKHLSSQSYWGKFADVRFVGENVVSVKRSGSDIFSGAGEVLSKLDGVYYVTGEGALYLLDADNGTAALAYCPPGVTELHIPASFTVPSGMPGEGEEAYARAYKVVSVLPHAILDAADLTAVTVAAPRQITLAMRAFADCPTLTSVNGLTTQKEANALFGANGTPAIRQAFINTGLTPDADADNDGGEARRSLVYTEPNAGRLTVSIRGKVVENGNHWSFTEKKAEELPYEDDAYRLLTGEMVGFDLTAQAYGKNSEAGTPFRVYFQASGGELRGFQTGTYTAALSGGGEGETVQVKTTYDAVAGCYCVSFSLPAGSTLVLSGIAGTDGCTVLYPGAEPNHPYGTPGGDLCVWGQVMPPVAKSDGETADDALPDNSGADYMMVNWSTERNLYGPTLKAYYQHSGPHYDANYARLDTSTRKPYFEQWHTVLAGLEAKSRTNDRYVSGNYGGGNGMYQIGMDPVEKEEDRFTVTLPEGLTWKAEEELNITFFVAGYSGEVESISEDRRTLVYTCSGAVNEYNGVLAVPALTQFNLCFDYMREGIDDSGYDYYTDKEMNKIHYKRETTVYHRYSAPYQTETVEIDEILKPLADGQVVFERDTTHPDGSVTITGQRGLSVVNTFRAYNASKDAAVTNLTTVTDELTGENGCLYLNAGQIADLLLDDTEKIGKYLKVKEIKISCATLYDGVLSPGEGHTATDGTAKTYDNLLNTYTAPKATNATLTFTAVWDDIDADTVPASLTLSVNGGSGVAISLPAAGAGAAGRQALEQEIDAALTEAGYLVPTGVYKITWDATEALRTASLPALQGRYDPDALIFGAYEASVKLDYEQANHRLKADSPTSFAFGGWDTSDNKPMEAAFYTAGSSVPIKSKTALNVAVSRIGLSVMMYNAMTDSFIGANQISPGVVLRYTVSYTNGNGVAYGELPFMQRIDSGQALLAPVDKNPALADKGFETMAFPEGNGRQYYILASGADGGGDADGAEGENGGTSLHDVWLGTADGDFLAETVTLSRRKSDGTGGGAVAYWYEKSLDAGQNKNYVFYTRVLSPVTVLGTFNVTGSVYANSYYHENPDYSARIYASTGATSRGEDIMKELLANPEKLGTEEEKTESLRNTYVGIGEQVTYRLTFNEYWQQDYTLPENLLYDVLPNTSGEFKWKLDENVEVRYAFLQRRADTSGEYVYETYVPDGEVCRIEKEEIAVDASGRPVVSGNGAAKEDRYVLKWENLVIPKDRTLYIYVTLTFPEEEKTWSKFADAADTDLHNTYCMRQAGGQTIQSDITHRIARSASVYLKTGMYGTDSDAYGYIYPNSDEVDRTIHYYLVIYNHGKSNAYLNPVHIKIPEGFTLVEPPDWYDTWTGRRPNWNASGVAVTDAAPPVTYLSQCSIENVGVDYTQGGREASLDITLVGDHKNETIGKYFLKPGEYVAVNVKFRTDGYQFTPDTAALPAAMPISDPHNAGGIVAVQGVDAHLGYGDYSKYNAGEYEFWDSDEVAQSRGFYEPDPSDTGKWAASELSIERREAKPGLVKSSPSKKDVGAGTLDYDPQEGASMEQPVWWVTKLANAGANSLTDYRVKDSIQWPYVFDGEVKLYSQINSSNDMTFEITRYYDAETQIAGQTVKPIDRGRLQVNGQEVRVAESRAAALADPDACSAQVFGEARVYFYKEDVFGDGHPAETMEFDMTQDRKHGVGPAPGGVGEQTRTLSYWTKFDMSQMENVSRSTYGNRMVLQPGQPYTEADVCEGIAIDENGNAVTDPSAQPDGILATGYVSINVGQSTVAWMTVEENGISGSNASHPDGRFSSKESKIVLEDAVHTVTYTMNVKNHVAGGAGSANEVTNKDDRRYSIKDMVIINTLPYVGDRRPVTGEPRGSKFRVASDDYQIKLYYYDEPVSGGTGSVKAERIELDERFYTVLYSEKRELQEIGNADWNLDGTKPDGWYTKEEFLAMHPDNGLAAANSVRIELHEPNQNFDALSETDRHTYRELMKPERTIIVEYEAKAWGGAGAGQTAWNSFGYHFNRFSGGTPMEAASTRVGIQIPGTTILYENLIDIDGNPYKADAPQTFKFTIRRKAEERADTDGTMLTIPEQQIDLTLVVGKGADEASTGVALTKLLAGTDPVPDAQITSIEWHKPDGDGDVDGFWVDGATYTVTQIQCPKEFPLEYVTINDGTEQRTSAVDFIYDVADQPVIRYVNRSAYWSSVLYKMDDSDEVKGYDPETIHSDEKYRKHFLPGALFGLYTTDESQRLDLAALADGTLGDDGSWDADALEEKRQLYVRYRSAVDKLETVLLDEGTDAETTLYLKDFQLTGDRVDTGITEPDGTKRYDYGSWGMIRWDGLSEESYDAQGNPKNVRYYIREIDPPTGYKLSETLYQISKTRRTLSVYDKPGILFPLTGGGGTAGLYLTGTALTAAGVALSGINRRRKGKRKKDSRNRRRKPAKTLGGIKERIRRRKPAETLREIIKEKNWRRKPAERLSGKKGGRAWTKAWMEKNRRRKPDAAKNRGNQQQITPAMLWKITKRVMEIRREKRKVRRQIRRMQRKRS